MKNIFQDMAAKLVSKKNWKEFMESTTKMNITMKEMRKSNIIMKEQLYSMEETFKK